MKRHNHNLRNTILGTAGGIALSANIAAQDLKNDATFDALNRHLEMHKISVEAQNLPTTLPDTLKDKKTYEYTQHDRAFENPQEGTTYVGGAIIGVSPVVTIAGGQTTNFNTNTAPDFNPADFPLKIKAYDSFNEFLRIVDLRIKYYEKHPEIVSRSRLERDKVAFEQIKGYQGYHATSKDSALIMMVEKDLSDMVLDEGESYILSKQVSDMGYKNALVPILIYHNGGQTTVEGKDGKSKTVTKSGESIPYMLNIAQLMQGPKGDTVFMPADTVFMPCPEQPKDTAQTKKDTAEVKKVRQIYIGGGAEYNNNLGIFIPQVAAGVQLGKVSFGGLFGYAKMNSSSADTLFESIPTTFINPQTGLEEVFGGTEITEYANNKMTREIFQPGVEIGLDITKNIRAGLGAQYNISKTKFLDDTTGTVRQWTTDRAGNRRDITIPLEAIMNSKNVTENYVSLNPSIEFKTGFNSPLNMSIYIGGKFPINSKYGNKPSYNAGVKLYFGNGRGSARN